MQPRFSPGPASHCTWGDPNPARDSEPQASLDLGALGKDLAVPLCGKEGKVTESL